MKWLLFAIGKLVFGGIAIRGGTIGFIFSLIMFAWAIADLFYFYEWATA